MCPRVIRFLILLAAIVAGILGGLGLTAWTIERPPAFGVVQLGPWQSRPRVGTAEADPYAKAMMAARGDVPMGAAEGLMLTARQDSDGQSLNGRCRYRISGPVPGANYWSLTVYRPDGTHAEARGLRAGFTSQEIVRFEGKPPVEIVLSAEAQPGNWLPLEMGESFVLLLRLYDTQLSASAHSIENDTVPAIRREACS